MIAPFETKGQRGVEVQASGFGPRHVHVHPLEGRAGPAQVPLAVEAPSSGT